MWKIGLSPGVDRLQLEVEFFRVRQCGGYKDAAKCSLEARHTHVQQVLIKIKRDDDLGFLALQGGVLDGSSFVNSSLNMCCTMHPTNL